MGNRNNILNVVPSKRFAGATEEDLTFQVSLNDSSRPLIQGDRTVNLNINTRFNEERQNISNYRVYGKISPIVDNDYAGLAINTDTSSTSSGFTTLLFQQLYYNQPAASPWAGYPQFQEFDFKRKDLDDYVSTTTNWNIFLSYPSENLCDQRMWYQMEESPTSNSIAFLD